MVFAGFVFGHIIPWELRREVQKVRNREAALASDREELQRLGRQNCGKLVNSSTSILYRAESN